jgi:hypothetical protein
MPDDDQQLNRLVTSKAAVNSVTWQVFSIFSAGMAVLVSAFAQAKTPLTTVVIAAIGVATSVVWLALQRRMIAHLVMHEDAIAVLEDWLAITTRYSASTQRNYSGLTKVNATVAFAGREVMILWISAVLLAWIATFAIKLYGFPNG